MELQKDQCDSSVSSWSRMSKDGLPSQVGGVGKGAEKENSVEIRVRSQTMTKNLMTLASEVAISTSRKNIALPKYLTYILMIYMFRKK